MAFDSEIILIKEKTKIGKMGVGHSEEIGSRTILCSERSAYKRDKSFARKTGLDAKYVVRVHSFEYDNETLANYKSKQFIISDVDMLENEICELTLSQKTEGANYD